MQSSLEMYAMKALQKKIINDKTCLKDILGFFHRPDWKDP